MRIKMCLPVREEGCCRVLEKWKKKVPLNPDMNKDQVREDVTLWPLELYFCCLLKLCFPETKEQCYGKVGARYFRKMRHSEADKRDKDNSNHMQ